MITKLQLQAGMDREGTIYSAEGRYYDGDKIRFRSGRPEKIGGWVRLSDNQYEGIARSLINWGTLSGANLLGVGTNLKYYIEDGGAYSDITPIRKIVDPMLGLDPPGTGDPFATAYNTLSADMTDSQQSLDLTDATSFPVTGGFIKIGTEEMSYNAITSNTLSGVVRGLNGTTPTAHTTGDAVSSSTITVSDANNGSVSGDFVIYSGATGPFGGFAASDINVEQEITDIIDTSTYTFNVFGVYSTSQASGGGAAAIAEYQVNTGLDVYVVGLGWGSDPWSTGGWGDPGAVGVGQQLRLWTADSYGEDLFFAPRNGGLYFWDATLGITVRGVLLNDASTTAGFSGQFVPNQTSKVLSAPIQRFIICMGANPYDPSDANSTFDPMLIRWSDQDNPFQWVPAITNQSGEFRLTDGSYIVASSNTRQEILIWTESALYSMQYIGAPLVYRFDIMMDNISIISPNAVANANSITYWMGRDKFYMYNGRVDTLYCSVRQYIFEDINKDQSYQIFSGSNEAFSEVWWFYCSRKSTTVDKYVVYNYLQNVWYFGSLDRTAWLDAPLRENPLAADYNNRILYHEVGKDDVSGLSPEPITAYVQSGDFDIGDGDRFGFIRRVLPDINFNGSTVDKPSVTMEVKPRRNSGAPYNNADNPEVQSADNYLPTRVYNIQEYTGQVYTRVRGRQMALRVESKDIGVAWQLGDIRLDIKPDGHR